MVPRIISEAVPVMPPGLEMADLVSIGQIAVLRMSRRENLDVANIEAYIYVSVRNDVRAEVGRFVMRSRAFSQIPGNLLALRNILTCPGMEQGVLEAIAKESLWSYVEELPERMRDLIRWHYLHGESLRSISFRLGLKSPSTLYERRDYALRRLRHRLVGAEENRNWTD